MSPQQAFDSIRLLNTGISCPYLEPKISKVLFQVYVPELHVTLLNCNQLGEVRYCRCCGAGMLSQYSEQKMRNHSIKLQMSKDCAYQSVITLICDLEGAEALIRSPWEGYSPVGLRACTEISFCCYPSFSFISSSFFLFFCRKSCVRFVPFKLPGQSKENHFHILFLPGSRTFLGSSSMNCGQLWCPGVTCGGLLLTKLYSLVYSFPAAMSSAA